jgi:adenylate kinase family enzyme
MLVEKYGFIHLSSGDLLREEQQSGSQNGELILKHINEGSLVPTPIVV